MRKEYFALLILFVIAFYFLYMNMKKSENFVVMAQAGPIPICSDPVHGVNCCGNHVLEPGIGEQCDGKDSDCSQCYQKCNFTSCLCYDFTPQLSGCDYYDNCDIANCCTDDFCNRTLHPTDLCHNVLKSVCNDTSKICHRWFTCSI